ncbi:uncharacterized protein TOT_010001093 [Theileria orientalis strain Shintoku]|uniref:phosphoinositide 5-phosphatase n=1 Tax=Theileria orientalis strain Shintoku TaxID=869250 RepID=J4DNV9_THEOR|nr:uncharacterized protein TOT_010001093 [Theileria orientalis strain Shintoku]BAM39639.1 uncharacterized protein TOT_010001093 [Theileria orientalis strain Shintoku]|eukprot:XP_009689940.1 uncharacterized protein TOT_010001093 [Theileria orientalis strain Shintoku]
MDGIYILKTFTSWYSIGLNRLLSEENYKVDSESPDVHDVFDDLKDYTLNDTKTLWIDRSTCQVSESLVPLTEEEPISENVIDAFLGIVEVMNTYHLGVVTRSEVVAELDLDNLGFNRRSKSRVMTIKEVKFLPIRSHQDVTYGSGDVFSFDAAMNQLSPGTSPSTNIMGSSNLANLATVMNSNNTLGDPGQYQMQEEVFKVLENMEKILATGYYYSYDTDLTNTMQSLYLEGRVPLRRMMSTTRKSGRPAEEDTQGTPTLYEVSKRDFNWGYKISQVLPRRWKTVLVQGYVGYRISHLNEEKMETLIIGRRNVKRSGTRYVARGIDEKGNVGNFVETEVRVRINEEKWYSYTQHRGSVPVFWEQMNVTAPVLLYNYHHNIRSFKKHVEVLNEYYRPNEYQLYVNLLDVKENEKVLTDSFMNVVDDYNRAQGVEKKEVSGKRRSKVGMIDLVNYNYNVNAKWNTHEIIIKYILEELNHEFNNIGYFDEEKDRELEGRRGLQRGIVRTNCLDCLDRTNIFQWMASWVVVNKILNNRMASSTGGTSILNTSAEGGLLEEATRTEANFSRLKEMLLTPEGGTREESTLFTAFTDLWCGHGDAISIHYSGTPSTLSERVKQTNTSLNSLFHYSKTMVQRLYHSLFQDNQRQAVFNILSPYTATGTGTGARERRLLNTKYYIQDPFNAEISREGAGSFTSGHETTASAGRGFEVPYSSDSDTYTESGRARQSRAQGTTDGSDSIFDKLQKEIMNKLTIKEQLEEEYEEAEFARKSLDQLKIWVGSWNIGAHTVDVNQDVLDWMELKRMECDLYVFSFQEFVELNFINIATGRTDENKEYEFEYFVENMFKLSTSHGFEKVTSISMTGLYLVIFVKRSLKPHIRDLLITNVKTGLNYNIGNKGSVGIQFNLFDYTLSFLNIHLNFGKNLNVGRIELLEYILKNAFKEFNKNVLDNDIFILGGDFNFHVQLEKQVVLNLLKKMEYTKLLNYDEFNMAKMIGIPVINRLHEASIQFQPTYKYKDGTKYYTTKRSPAWCDRIIFGGRLFESRKINILSYKRNDNLMISDHRPVSSIILVDLK